ncbi:MAG: hypothetical protein P8N94_06600 [Gammaproteobacteria bacterium]|nr:hypothetical protein [Gammaproteobacteria bacterium]
MPLAKLLVFDGPSLDSVSGGNLERLVASPEAGGSLREGVLVLDVSLFDPAAASVQPGLLPL